AAPRARTRRARAALAPTTRSRAPDPVGGGWCRTNAANPPRRAAPTGRASRERHRDTCPGEVSRVAPRQREAETRHEESHAGAETWAPRAAAVVGAAADSTTRRLLSPGRKRQM